LVTIFGIGYACCSAGHRIEKHLRIARFMRWAGSGFMFLWVVATAVLLGIALAALP
jgi:hypothetical protein